MSDYVVNTEVELSDMSTVHLDMREISWVYVYIYIYRYMKHLSYTCMGGWDYATGKRVKITMHMYFLPVVFKK
jgi:hypothetical protein